MPVKTTKAFLTVLGERVRRRQITKALVDNSQDSDSTETFNLLFLFSRLLLVCRKITLFRVLPFSTGIRADS